MNLIFFAVSELAYSQGANLTGFQDYYSRSRALAIITICIICIYGLFRWFFNAIGGLYMFKRIISAVILVFSYDHPALLAALIVM
jgi:hypothetical protein